YIVVILSYALVASLPKEKIIDIEAHAFLRLMERSNAYALSYVEAKERAFAAVRSGRLATRKHLSNTGKTYYLYFKDNLSFYVICQEKEGDAYTKIVIRTVIIEQGRE
ncbi:hypothetical protein HYU19_01795, partial [Candidatus Woesearchaeota archaeon]|nr:hypothetical protein [Candidatus Woesearchaeota archaeon]